MNHYNLAVCGGTFDNLHKGHREFIQYVLSRSRKLVIGLTSDHFLISIDKNHKIEPFTKRKQALRLFLKKNFTSDRVNIIAINDMYGPTLDNSFYAEAIFVTPETKNGAELINKKRSEIGLSMFKIMEFPLILGEDNQPISSTRIRNGEINREGILYLRQEWLDNTLKLPNSYRYRLKKPFGQLIRNFDSWIGDKSSLNPSETVTVGDIVTRTFNKYRLRHKLSIVDFHVERKKQFTNLSEHGFLGNETKFTIINKPGTLSSDLSKTVSAIFKDIAQSDRFVIQVKGEEDLAVIPVVLRAPLGFVVFYGQPGQGVVRIEVSKESKNKVFKVASNFNKNAKH